MVKMYCELMERVTVEPARYHAHEAARLAGVPGDRIGQWARWGHIRASISASEPHVYSFADVAEALAVHLLLDAGLPLPVIRRAVDRLDGTHPLSSGRVHVVDGVLAVERAEGLEDVFTEQRVLELDGRVEVDALLRRGGWPTRLTGVTEVEVDPARACGHPCVRGRRVAVEDAAAEPEAYGLTAAQAADAARWWACVLS
jgi:DNA-binding transcriptional MerR regulator